MDTRDYIDEILLHNGNLQSLYEILENSIIELDRNTANSRDRKKILKFLNQFSVLLDSILRENNEIKKECYSLWDIVIKLEEKDNA